MTGDETSQPRPPHPWRRSAGAAAWVFGLTLNMVFNGMVSSADNLRRLHPATPAEPWVWEISSTLSIMLLLPAVVAAAHRWPYRWQGLWRRLLVHLALSVPFCLAHVALMVAFRKAVYAAAGGYYDFDHATQQLAYEYLKDVRTWFLFVGFVCLYDFVLRRLQGEASLLAAPDEGPPVEPLDRPERFLVRKLGKEFLVNAREVERVQASGNYVNLLVRGHEYPLRATMANIEQRLDPERFVRVHRSYLVNLDYLAEIEPLDSGDARLRLASGAMVPCSRRYRANLRDRADGTAAV